MNKTFLHRRFACFLLCFLLPAAAAAQATNLEEGNTSERLQVGEYHSVNVQTPHPYATSAAAEPEVVWSYELFHPGASYVAPHFSRFELAEGDYVVIRSPDWSRSWKYEGYGKADLGRAGGEGFWGIHIRGPRAIIELYSDGSEGAFGLAMDRYASGYPELDMTLLNPLENRSICTTDDKENAVCYASSEPEIYNESRSVVRLLIAGSSLCTGWLLGDEGHMMTNQHCIENASDAMNTDYEFMAEGATCQTNCPQLQCDGTIEATSATLIQLNAALDYALVQLPTNLSGTYGFMQFRETGAVLEERIYSPQHPAGRGKEIAVFSSYPDNPSGFAEVDSVNEPICSGGTRDIGYFMDTEGGSSGSPVLGYSDHLVVSLHHCRGSGFCSSGGAGDDPNRGVPVEDIIADLGANLPNNAIGMLDPIIFVDSLEAIPE